VTISSLADIEPSSLRRDTQDRSAWRTLRSSHTVRRRFASRGSGTQKKQSGSRSNLSAWPRDSCSRVCSSRIGLHAHQQPSDDKRCVCVCVCVCVKHNSISRQCR